MSCVLSIPEFERYVTNENYKTIWSLNCLCFHFHFMKNREYYLEACVCHL